nr:putative late blight resistance protein homolog R1B-16 [Ipomoea batatas]
MADAAVEFLGENLKQLLQNNVELISGIKEQAESLQSDASYFKAFLKEAARRRSQNEMMKELVKKIRIAANKAEDAIDKFVVEETLHRSKRIVNRYFDKPAHLLKVKAIAKEIESIRKEVNGIRQNNAYGLQALQMDDASKDAAERKAPVVEEDDVVGFDEEAKTIIDRLNGGSDDLEVTSIFGELNTYRRLCVHSRVLDFIRSSRESGERVRSFLCFSSKEIELPLERIEVIHGISKAYQLLRVLEMKPIMLTRFPKEMSQLFHLRYIALSSDIKIIPPSIGNLRNMQILIIETSQRTLEIKADIWSMQRFRHLHTNACTNLPSPLASKSSKDWLITGSLNTLSTISPESCTQEVLTRTPNLTNLGIRGKLSSLVESKGPSMSMLFDNLGKLDHLENLKLLNDVILAQTGKPWVLPPAYKFPSKLKKLTISNTSLEWGDMEILGTLENLEVLKLDDNAFKGENWKLVDGGFRHLQFFCIGRTDLASWQASSHHFPRLKFLALRHCNKLEAVPFGLADIPSLQMMELYSTNKIAAESARKIQQHKQMKQEQEGTKNGGFKLSIYPPDH